jgi:DNA-binding transcriptional LysR family regulator
MAADLFDSMRIFVSVVERGSFSAVARELNIEQPTESEQIRALEQYQGGPVFATSTRHLALGTWH